MSGRLDSYTPVERVREAHFEAVVYCEEVIYQNIRTNLWRRPSSPPPKREYDENHVKPPTLDLVGLGLDMMFMPGGAFSIPRHEARSDPRPIDWMLTSFDEMKPLAVVREELRTKSMEKLVRACSEDMTEALSARLPSLSGRALYPGEAPPF